MVLGRGTLPGQAMSKDRIRRPGKSNVLAERRRRTIARSGFITPKLAHLAEGKPGCETAPRQKAIRGRVNRNFSVISLTIATLSSIVAICSGSSLPTHAIGTSRTLQGMAAALRPPDARLVGSAGPGWAKWRTSHDGHLEITAVA